MNMDTRQIFTICAVLISNSLFVSADELITQYRYRAFDGTTPPAWVSSHSSSTILPTITKVERGESGDAFQQFWYANFDGSKKYVCLDDIPGNDLSGDFSVQAFFCLNSTSGVQTICTTVSDSTGFRLYVENGILKGGCHYSNPTGDEVILAAPSTDSLQAGIWYHVAFVASRNSGSNINKLHLWIDSAEVATYETVSARPIDNSTRNPVFGESLDAKVYAIEVFDYALFDFYLESPAIRDGSRGLGIPSYHDYIGENASTLERRIVGTYSNGSFAEFRSMLKKQFFFPFINDNFIPQGLAADPENNRLFLAMYYGKETSTTATSPGNPDNFPSIIVEILMPDGHLGNVLNLRYADGSPMKSHVGGLAYWKNRLYVPNGRNLLIYDIDDIPKSEFSPATLQGFNPIDLAPSFEYANLVSFNSIAFIDLDIDSDHIPYIFLGDFDHGGQSDTDVVRLDSEGYISEPEKSRLFLETPTKDSQGVKVIYAHYNSAAPEYRRTALFSTSYSTGNSLLHVAKYINGESDSSGLLLSGPAGFEDLAMLNGLLWTSSESGARHYQKRTTSPWNQLFPFLFAVNIDDQLDQDGNGLPDQWTSRFDLPGTILPNGDTDGDGFSTVEEYLADTDPLLFFDYPRIDSITSSGEIAFHTSLSRFFTFEWSEDLIDWFPMPGLTHRRGADAMERVIVPNKNSTGFYRLKFEDR